MNMRIITICYNLKDILNSPVRLIIYLSLNPTKISKTWISVIKIVKDHNLTRCRAGVHIFVHGHNVSENISNFIWSYNSELLGINVKIFINGMDSDRSIFLQNNSCVVFSSISFWLNHWRDWRWRQKCPCRIIWDCPRSICFRP